MVCFILLSLEDKHWAVEQAWFAFVVAHATVTIHSASVTQIERRINSQIGVLWSRGTANAIQVCKLVVCSGVGMFENYNNFSEKSVFTHGFAFLNDRN